MTDLPTLIGQDLQIYSLLIVAGIIVFTIWAISKSAAKRAGSRFGWGALAGIVFVLGILLATLVPAQAGLGWYLILIGFVGLLIVIFAGRSRR